MATGYRSDAPDGTDEAILEILVQDARATYGAIGIGVGLSAPAVKRRVDRLLALGVIKRFTIDVDHNRRGERIEAFTELTFRGDARVDDIAGVADGVPEVVRVFTMAGAPDALAWLRVRDVDHLQVVIDRLRAGGQVIGTKTMIVLRSS